MHCPICAQTLEGGELVMVCTGCHQALGGGLKLGSTGEFRVPSAALFELAEAVSGDGREGGAGGDGTDASGNERPQAQNVCSWCGKLERQVRKLLGRGATALCDECVSLCCDILDAELGSSWR